MSACVSGVSAFERSTARTRRGLLFFAGAAVILSAMHHVDHVIRGNHSGWPFQTEVAIFTFSLLIYALILPGIHLTARGYKIASYHLFVALGVLALLGSVHFVPAGGHETPIRDIYLIYGNPLAGLFTLVVLAALIVSVALLTVTAFEAIRYEKGVENS